MRSLSKAAFAFACALAFLSISFIAVTAGDGDLANQSAQLADHFAVTHRCCWFPASLV